MYKSIIQDATENDTPVLDLLLKSMNRMITKKLEEHEEKFHKK